MKLQCPSCYAHFSLDAAIGAGASGLAIVAALKVPAPLANAVVTYLALFRAPGRSLAHDRAAKLLAELQPMLDGEFVQRNGSQRRAPVAVWLV